MGNSAMSSCVQGPAQFCVRVLLPDGKLLQFAQPVLVIQVMQEHPGHLVVKFMACASSPPSQYSAAAARPSNTAISRQGGYVAPSNGKRSADSQNVTVLRADEELELGSTYYLLRITEDEERMRTPLKSIKTSSKVASSFEYESSSESPSSEKMLKRLRRMATMPAPREPKQQRQRQEQPFHEDIVVRRSPRQSLGKLLMEGTGKESYHLSLYQTFGLLDCRQFSKSRRQRRFSPISWTPVLESIPEALDEFLDEEEFAPLYIRTHHHRPSRALRRHQSLK